LEGGAATGGDDGDGGGGISGIVRLIVGGGIVRRGRLAAAEHPMRAYRARLLRLCRCVLPDVYVA
jgi:hypothetical protein